MACMRKIVRCIGVGLAVTVFLWLCGQAGYRYLGYCKYLTSPAACLGKMICWGGIFGTAGGTAVVIGYIWARKLRDSGFLTACSVAFFLILAIRLSGLVVTFCS